MTAYVYDTNQSPQSSSDLVFVTVVTTAHLIYTIDRASALSGCSRSKFVAQCLEEWLGIDHVKSKFRAVFFDEFLEQSTLKVLKSAVSEYAQLLSPGSQGNIIRAINEFMDQDMYRPCFITVGISRELVRNSVMQIC